MDALKHEKKSDRVFHCNYIVQIIAEICSISRREIFKVKRSLLLLESEEKTPFTLTFLIKYSCFVWFWMQTITGLSSYLWDYAVCVETWKRSTALKNCICKIHEVVRCLSIDNADEKNIRIVVVLFMDSFSQRLLIIGYI